MDEHQKTVLIVDDDLAFSDMLSEVLRDLGVRVLVEHDGAAGLARALEARPQLLILDVMMPRMTGVALLAEVRKDPWGATVPTLMLTNMGERPGGHEADKNAHYLLKTDVTLDDIAQRAAALLAEDRRS